MKKNVAHTLILIGLFVLCLTFSLTLIFAGKGVEETPVRKKTLSSGETVNAVSVMDVKGVMQMIAVNYLPNDFAGLSDAVSDQDDGSKPAKRGTYRFVIDTLAQDEWSESGSLDRLLKPDGNWHLTMYIPPVFAACAVFVQYENVEYVGTIDRYNINYYLNYSSPSEFDDAVSHKTATKPIFLDIPISADGKYSKECKITIHYEADNENFVGLFGPILIGEDSAVHATVDRNRAMSLSGAIVGAVTFLLFILICVLKRSLSFVPQLLFAAGIFLAMFSTYMLFGFTTVPYFLLAIRRFSAGFLIFASSLYLPQKAGRVPVLYPTSAAAIVATILAFISPFCTTVAAHAAVCMTYIVLAFACVIVVFAFTLRDIYKNKPLGLRLTTVIIGVSTVMALFATHPIPFTMLSPAFWLYFVELCVTLVLGLREFITAERHNRYLTANLEQEVSRQTQSLQDVIAERDNILLYVSHDMKKTVSSMGDALTDLRQKLSAPEAVEKVDRLLQKTADLKKDFADLGKYNKQNYVAEQSEEVNVSRIVQSVTDDLRPDCEANGIVLTVTVPETLNVYAKKSPWKASSSIWS